MGKTVVHGNFEWDSDKAEKNIKKHGISELAEMYAFLNDSLSEK